MLKGTLTNKTVMTYAVLKHHKNVLCLMQEVSAEAQSTIANTLNRAQSTTLNNSCFGLSQLNDQINHF